MKLRLDQILLRGISEAMIETPVSEYRFHDKRKFRFDFAWVDQKVAVEIEGAIFVRGRHTRGIGYNNDCVKYNLAVVNGWRVLRYTQLNIDNAIDEIKALLDA